MKKRSWRRKGKKDKKGRDGVMGGQKNRRAYFQPKSPPYLKGHVGCAEAESKGPEAAGA